MTTADDLELEAKIAEANLSVECHYQLSKITDDDLLRGFYRDEARRMAARVRTLVAQRSSRYVSALEVQRGLA